MYIEIYENNLCGLHFLNKASSAWICSLTASSCLWRLNTVCLQIVVLSEITRLASAVMVKYLGVWHVVAWCLVSKHTQPLIAAQHGSQRS